MPFVLGYFPRDIGYFPHAAPALWRRAGGGENNRTRENNPRKGSMLLQCAVYQ
jgi:hypothetical protein